MRLLLLLPLLVAMPAAAVVCGDASPPQPLPVRTTLVAPFAPEMSGLPQVLGASSGLLVGARDEALAVDVVLLRLRSEACAAQAQAENVGDAYAGYQKKTEHDNTPWRYETKPGERFSAAEFDAWMKSRGVRVAKGRPATTVDETEAPAVVGE